MNICKDIKDTNTNFNLINEYKIPYMFTQIEISNQILTKA